MRATLHKTKPIYYILRRLNVRPINPLWSAQFSKHLKHHHESLRISLPFIIFSASRKDIYMVKTVYSALVIQVNISGKKAAFDQQTSGFFSFVAYNHVLKTRVNDVLKCKCRTVCQPTACRRLHRTLLSNFDNVNFSAYLHHSEQFYITFA